MRPIVYVAGPIDGNTDPMSPIVSAAMLLRKAGLTTYSPALAWANVEDQATVQDVNEDALLQVQGMLAFLPDAIPTIGTPMEIERARVLGKPVVVVGGVMAGRSPVLASRDVPVYEDLETAVLHLAELLLRPPPEARFIRSITEIAEAVESQLPSWMMTIEAGSAAWLDAVGMEIERARAKHTQSHRTKRVKWFSILMEEVVEMTQAWNDGLPDDELAHEVEQVGAMAGRLWRSIREGDPEDA